MLKFLIHQTIETLGVKRCAIFEVFSGPELVALVAGEPKNEHGVGMKFSFKDLEALKEVVGIKSYLLINEPRQDKRTWHSRELIYHRGINVILFVPILAQDEVIGVIVIDATGERKTFTEEEIYFCVVLSNLVGVILERDLIHKEREEEKTLMFLGQAAAEVAHRLRNPLVVIGGFARRLAKLKDPLCQDYASHIIAGADKMDAVISGLLRFSAPKKAQLTETKINEVIKEVEKLIPELIGARKIRVSLQLDSGIPAVLFDPTEIEDVLSSILRNAVEAVDAGVDGIVVSNHGGRVLDFCQASIEVLPAIVKAVGSKIEVLIDGGFRRGTDVLKALALGAKGVLVGRPICWGLAAAGAEGVAKVLQMMTSELIRTMTLTNVPDVSKVPRDVVILT